MSVKISEKNLFISITLFILALVCAYSALFLPALRGSRWPLVLFVIAFIIGRMVSIVFNSSVKKIKQTER